MTNFVEEWVNRSGSVLALIAMVSVPTLLFFVPLYALGHGWLLTFPGRLAAWLLVALGVVTFVGLMASLDASQHSDANRKYYGWTR